MQEIKNMNLIWAQHLSLNHIQGIVHNFFLFAQIDLRCAASEQNFRPTFVSLVFCELSL